MFFHAAQMSFQVPNISFIAMAMIGFDKEDKLF